MKKSLFVSLMLSVPMLLFAQGTLTAYYAKANFSHYKKGQLIVDTNDPINRMVKYSKTKYKYEGDNTGVYYSERILKSNVIVKTYKMSDLPVALVCDGAIFRSDDGYEVRIFPANAAGHLFKGVDYEDNFRLFVDEAQTAAHQHHYVISGQLKKPYISDGLFFEDPLEVENGNIKLYRKASEVGYGCDIKGNLRYRPYKMGFIEDKWTPPEEYGYEKSAYNAKGDLLTDLQVITDIPEYLSIAWIEEENALYIDGTLYYKQ